ncbi:MAG: hypothetical protein AAF441_04770 [Pseudomonadota bacterium]
MQKSLQKVGIPRSLRDRIVVGTKKLLAPGEVGARQAAAAGMTPPRFLDTEQFKQNGSYLVPARGLASAPAASKALRVATERLRARGKMKKPEDQRKADFLVQLLGNEDVLSIPEVLEFALGDELVALTSSYFDEVPVISRVDLWWSPPNKSKAESQLYHFDGEDKSQLKVILLVNDVDADTGPFTFVDAVGSGKVGASRRHSARLDDDAVESIAGESAVTSLMGPAGTVGVVDTSRCLHYGSRGNSKERLLMMIQFTRFLAPKASFPDWKSLLTETDLSSLNKNQRMVLGLA